MHTVSHIQSFLSTTLTVGLLTSSLALAQQPPSCPYADTPTAYPLCHPYPQPRLHASTVQTAGDTTTVNTGTSIFPKPAVSYFVQPPGTNFLPTVYTNMFDGTGQEMPNTLPSTPSNPYNLHDGDPVVSQINPTSPTDDLRQVLEVATRLAGAQPQEAMAVKAVIKALQFGIDIVEGNPVANRAYSGLPLLHYTGPEKVRKVTPILDVNGQTIGGNVDVHQVWYDSHIESDTSLLDVSAVLEVPWTITYTVDVLTRGEDDFSPFVMYFDDPALTPGMPLPHIGMDQSFFPMQDGTRTVFKIKMTPGKYFSLTYTWGWRMHPPRAQVIENVNKKVAGKTMLQWEQEVFGTAPRASAEAKLKAIAMIGDLSPAKRLWQALRQAREAAQKSDSQHVLALLTEARAAFRDWQDRTMLPRDVAPDPGSDLTLLYVNNTIYTQMTDLSQSLADSIRINFPAWQLRGTPLKVTIYNGDYFEHGYQNVDFGGGRGWENQFKSSVKLAGSGCWFTFGRAHWWMNIPNTTDGNLAVVVPAARQEPLTLGVHKVHLTFNYEPSQRLRFYQFDPLHHDVAIMSIH